MTPRYLSAGLLLLLGTGLLPGPGRAQSDPPPSLGPLRITERNPLYRLFLTPRGAAADPLPQGRLEIRTSGSYSNIFETSTSPGHLQYFDLERLTSTLTLEYGLAPGFELGLHLASQTNWGGFLDGFIREYHGFLGLKNGNRDRVENGLFGLVLEHDGERKLDVPSGTRLEDLVVSATWAIFGEAGGAERVSIRSTTKLPTGSSALGTGRWNAGLELVGRRSWQRAHLHGSIGVVTLNGPESLETFTNYGAVTWSLAGEYRLFSRISALAQLLGTSPYVDGFGDTELDSVPLNLVLGAAGEFGRGWLWEASFAEDLVANGPSVDFTVDLQVGRALNLGR
jgi:hypothetical protein